MNHYLDEWGFAKLRAQMQHKAGEKGILIEMLTLFNPSKECYACSEMGIVRNRRRSSARTTIAGWTSTTSRHERSDKHWDRYLSGVNRFREHLNDDVEIRARRCTLQ